MNNAQLKSKTSVRVVASALLGLAAVGAANSSAHAAIFSVLPAAVLIAPPPAVVPGALMGPDIYAFNEEQNVFLTAPILVDVQPVNQVVVPADLNPGVIPAGTCVSSHYVHYEPGALATADGGVRFFDDILGVEVLQPSLDATNFLGAPGTVYPVAAACVAGAVDCGMELLPQDGLRVDARRVRVTFTAANPGDRIRVITKGIPAVCAWKAQQQGH